MTRLVVRGTLVESCTVGSTIVLRTTAQVYVVHADSVPALCTATALRIREVYQLGDHSFVEVGNLFSVGVETVREALDGSHATIRHLGLGKVVTARSRASWRSRADRHQPKGSPCPTS